MADPYSTFVYFFTHPNPAYLAFGAVAVFLVALGLARSKDLLISILVALYVSALITALFPYHGWVHEALFIRHPTLVPLFIFGFSAVVTLLSLRRYILSNYQHRPVWRTIEVVVLSLMVTGLSFSILHHIVGIASLFPGWQASDFLFASKQALTFWLIAPVLSFPLFIRP